MQLRTRVAVALARPVVTALIGPLALGAAQEIAKRQKKKSFYTTQGYLQIQCNPYQVTKDIFHSTRTKYFKVCLEAKQTQNSQRHPEKEK